MAFFLPELQLGQGVDIPEGNAGIWNQQERKAFENVASSLEVPNFQSYVDNVSAIPDIWARPLAFDMALHNRKHPLHGQMVSQWQGMLAAVALAEVRGFPLKVEFLELGKLKEQDRFARSLHELMPKFSNDLYQLDQKSPWEDIYLFLWQGQAVGMTTPSTLLCPAEAGAWQGLPWWSEGRLHSPLSRDSLNLDEKQQLWHWLEGIRHQIGEDPHPAKTRIRELLKEFRDRLASQSPNLELGLSEKSAFFGVTITRGCLKALNRPIRSMPKPSNVTLRPSATKTPNRPLLIIPDPAQITEQAQRAAKDIWIYEATTLATLTDENIRRWSTSAVQCLREQDLFLPEFSFINRPNALPGSILPKTLAELGQVYEGREITPLLPINPMLLDYLTATDLNKLLEVRTLRTPTGMAIEFSLLLPLSGGMGGTSPAPFAYRVSRTYPLKKENMFEEVPVLELWPNFRLDSWQEYHAFLYDPNLETFQVNFPTAKQMRVFKGMGSFHYPNYSFPDTESNCLLAQFSEFPEFAECTSLSKGTLGLILLKAPPQINTAINHTWKVGVDFGTSFTNVYIERNGALEQLKIKPLHFQVTDSNPEIQQPSLYEYFIASNMELPLSTVVSLRGPGKLNRSESSLTQDAEPTYPLSEGRVLIPRDSSTFRPGEDYWIKTNLKWGGQSDDCVLFLQHLILQITAQAVVSNASNIQWAISYPSAFSRSDIRSYARNWRLMTSELQSSTGVIQTCPELDDTSYFRTESLAAAQYFADYERPGVKSRLDLVKATCIDIGGGSSDISIWENNTLVHQCSVQLAGKDLFSQMIQMNPGFLVRKFSGVGELEEWKKLQGFQFFVKLDVLIKHSSNGWLSNARDRFAEDPEFQGLVQLMSLGIAGLYYYVGLLLKALHQEGKYSEPEITPVYLGGNGCRLLNWLAEGGEFDRHCEANDLFSEMLSLASGFEDSRVSTYLSPSPKDEVACGLVIADPKGPQGANQLIGLDRKDPDFMIAGEACEINGQRLDWNSRMEFKDKLDTIKVPTLTQLPQFLKSFHIALDNLDIEGMQPLTGYTLSEDIQANAPLWKDTQRSLQAALLRMAGNAEDVRPEPPFILGLKALLETLGKQWAEKYRR
jgi:hypothetical protein